MLVFPTARDLAAAAGSDLGQSTWVTIDQPLVDAFARLTRDEQWIHVDVTRARSGPLGGTIAHGHLVLSLVPSFLRELYSVEQKRMVLNYGLNRVRFTSPVLVGSRIAGRGTILTAERVDSGVQVTFRVQVVLHDQPKPACVAECVVRYLD